MAIALALFAPLLQVPSLALGQLLEPGGRRIVTTTRLVARFSDLEQQLAGAIQHKDEAALSRFLSEEFEQWTPEPPGDPLPRQEWLHKVLTAFTLQSFQLQQMAVRLVGETAVVSFVIRQQAVCNGQDCSVDAFIVDLWQPHDGASQLLVRYASQVRRPPQPPGSAPRPTGKE